MTSKGRRTKHDRDLNYKDKRRIWNTIEKIFIGVCIFVFTIIWTKLIIMLAYVPSGSMVPTLNVGDLLIGWRVGNDYKRKDIVVFEGEDNKFFVKRLIGMPGDHIEIIDRAIYINGKRISEPYLEEQMVTENRVFDIPKDHYLFLGDNRNHSYDARFWDNPYVSKKKLKAKIILRIYPFKDFRIFFRKE